MNREVQELFSLSATGYCMAYLALSVEVITLQISTLVRYASAANGLQLSHKVRFMGARPKLMHVRAAILLAAFMLVPGLLLAQEVNARVDSIDPAAQLRVQDPDRSDNAMVPSSSGSAQRLTPNANQYPSLSKASVWGPSSLAATPSQGVASIQGRTQGSQRSMRANGTRRLNATTTVAEIQSARLGRLPQAEAGALEANGPANSPKLNLIRLKRAVTRSARIRITSPFQEGKQDTEERWQHDSSSARALAQQQHESGLLLQQGFNARSERRAHRGHRHHATSSGTEH